jgi:cell division protein FtsB
MTLLPKLLKLIKNKYFIVCTSFLIWMTFFDLKDWGLIADRVQKLKELQKNEQQFTKKIVETRAELVLLKSNAQTIERYAREKYLMKKDNEDLFIVKLP